MIRLCADYGIAAQRVPGRTGCWVGDEKIGAIGVRISAATSSTRSRSFPRFAPFEPSGDENLVQALGLGLRLDQA